MHKLASDIEFNKQLVEHGSLNLEVLREQLIRQEETIIFSIIERAQYKHNKPVYESGGVQFNIKEESKKGGKLPSFLDFFFNETEKVHALVRRYTSPDEHPFFPNDLPEPVLPLIDFPQLIKPNTVNINDKIKSLYLDVLLPQYCESGDDKQYGSTATCDISVLQALSKRIHYGKFVAEAKFQAAEHEYATLIEKGDVDGLKRLLTNESVEEKLLKRVYLKASTYGQEIEKSDKQLYKVHPELIVSLYKDHIIPLTKEVQILYLMQRLQGPSVAFLGPLGTFSQQAAIQYLESSTSSSRKNINFNAVQQITDVFTSVISNKTIFGIVPIENSQTGIIRNHMDLLIHSETKVCGEIYLPISFCLMSNSKPEQIKKVYSHAQGLEQCKKWLKSHYPDIQFESVSSTAKAVEIAAKEEGSAAVANSICSDIYKVKIVAENIQDTESNTTRFLVISKHFGTTSGKDKSIVTFTSGHVPGALMKSLQAFQFNGVNLTTIQSFPDKNSGFNYNFYIELEGHIENDNVKKSLEELKKTAENIRVVGSFPFKDATPIITPKKIEQQTVFTNQIV